MTDKDLYGGLIRLHILHHAAEEPVFGLGIIEELRRHGYEMSAGTVYPMLHGLEKKGYLTSRHERTGRRERRVGNDSNLLIVFYVQIMPDDFVMQLHRF